jgi:hypothetical protein
MRRLHAVGAAEVFVASGTYIAPQAATEQWTIHAVGAGRLVRADHADAHGYTLHEVLVDEQGLVIRHNAEAFDARGRRQHKRALLAADDGLHFTIVGAETHDQSLPADASTVYVPDVWLMWGLIIRATSRMTPLRMLNSRLQQAAPPVWQGARVVEAGGRVLELDAYHFMGHDLWLNARGVAWRLRPLDSEMGHSITGHSITLKNYAHGVSG